jgi:hypothetical protein
MNNKKLLAAMRASREQREAEARAEKQTPTYQLYLKIRDQLLPRDNLAWAREAIVSDDPSGAAMSLAVNTANTLKKLTYIYCDETLTEAEKEAAYNKACEEAKPRRFEIKADYYETLLTKFKALV